MKIRMTAEFPNGEVVTWDSVAVTLARRKSGSNEGKPAVNTANLILTEDQFLRAKLPRQVITNLERDQYPHETLEDTARRIAR